MKKNIKKKEKNLIMKNKTLPLNKKKNLAKFSTTKKKISSYC